MFKKNILISEKSVHKHFNCLLAGYLPTGVIIVIMSMLFAACSATKYLKKDEYLLKSYEIKTDESEITDFGLDSYVKQKPNKRILRLPIYANIYNLVNPEKEAIREKKRQKKEEKMNRRRLAKGKEPRKKIAISRWILSIGEEPVIYNAVATKKSALQITKLLKNKGYFHANTKSLVKFEGKTAKVEYNIKAGKPFLVRNYTDSVEDPTVSKMLKSYWNKESSIKTGERVDVSFFEKEREAINERMLNNGYYRFAKGYIFFQIDTFVGNNQADIHITIKSPTKIDDMGVVTKVPYKKYHLNDIAIYPDYEAKSVVRASDNEQIDYTEKPYKNGISFRIAKKSKFTKALLTRGLTLEKDSLYRAKNAKSSFKYYSSLGNFRLVNFEFKEPNINKSISDTSKNYLYPHIRLSPSIAQSFTIDLEGNITSGRYGMASNFLYRNTNIFGGAEILDVSFKVELNNQEEGSEDKDSYFSDTEYGVNTSIRFPNLVMPFSSRSFYLKYFPKTAFSLGYNFRNNSKYQRYMYSATYGYDWRSSDKITHLLNIVEYSSVKLSSLNIEYLKQLNKTGQFNEKYDHLILGASYTIRYNSQKVNKTKDFHYIMFKVESAGNLLNIANKTAKSPKLGYGDYLKEIVNLTTPEVENRQNVIDSLNNEGSFFTLFNLPYAQYIKTEIDFRYYQVINKKNEIVYRINPGIIFPYSNSKYSPQEKRFFLGGASSMRAWQARQLGPGSYHDTTGIYQYGDIKLEMNLEYRFNIFWMLDGALFFDAGNIWSLDKDSKKQGDKFDIARFYKEIAFGTGLGIRMDLDFFVIRFDFGFKLYDPSLPEDKRWLGLDALKWRSMTFNFGIGYPF